MRVVVTGANSAVGQAILRIAAAEQRERPLTVVAAVRSERAARDLAALAPTLVVRIDYSDLATLTSAFTGASAVIHLAGTLIERGDSTYERANVQTARAVAEVAERAGVEKVVLVSATFADPGSSNRYWKSKGQAEDAIRQGRCAHTILRAPLLLGPGTEATAALQRHVGAERVILPGGGRNRQQPLDVDDLARAALRATDPSVARNRTLDLVGPVSILDREIVERAARLRGRGGSHQRDADRDLAHGAEATRPRQPARLFRRRPRRHHR